MADAASLRQDDVGLTHAEGRRVRDRWIAWILAHHRLVIALGLLLTAVFGALASRLHIDSDLRVLLPPGHAVVRSLDRVEASFSSTGSVDVVVRGATPALRRAFAEAFAEELVRDPMIDAVELRLPSEFFLERALYYVDDETFAELIERVDAWSHAELCAAAPDLCLAAPDPEARARLEDFIAAQRRAALERAGFEDYFEREGVDALVLLLHPRGSTSDLAFCRAVAELVRRRGDAIAARDDAPWAGGELRWAAIGPYVVKADEHRAVVGDMVRSGALGLCGVLLVLGLLFRSARAVLSLLLPLLCGVTWAVGATQLVLGHLNTITAMIASVIMGMGIDAGIHMLLRARRERCQHGDVEAIRRAFVDLIAPLLVASGTTLGAFVVMASSAVPAFREFGIIALLGVCLCVLAMVTVFPALLCLVGVDPARRGDDEGSRGVISWCVRRPGLTLALVVVVSAVATDGARRVAFENNGRMLQSGARRGYVSEHRALINEIFGHEIHAGVLIVESLDEARETLARGARERARREAAGERSYVAELFAAPDVLPDPAIDLAARAEAIAELRDDLPSDLLDEPERGAASEERRWLRKMLAPSSAPDSVDALPEGLRRRLRADDGTYAVYAYPSFDAAEIVTGVEYMAETRDYAPRASEEDAEARVFVGESTVYGAAYLMMRREAPVVILSAAALVIVLVAIQLRSLPLTVITVLPLGLGLWWLVAVMGWSQVHFTLFNIPILPAVVGIGVDNGVYLTDRIRQLHAAGVDEPIARGVRETGAAILSATATTAIGFGALRVADNGGLAGIGTLAVLGVMLAAAAALWVVPVACAASLRRRENPRA